MSHFSFGQFKVKFRAVLNKKKHFIIFRLILAAFNLINRPFSRINFLPPQFSSSSYEHDVQTQIKTFPGFQFRKILLTWIEKCVLPWTAHTRNNVDCRPKSFHWMLKDVFFYLLLLTEQFVARPEIIRVALNLGLIRCWTFFGWLFFFEACRSATTISDASSKFRNWLQSPASVCRVLWHPLFLLSPFFCFHLLLLHLLLACVLHLLSSFSIATTLRLFRSTKSTTSCGFAPDLMSIVTLADWSNRPSIDYTSRTSFKQQLKKDSKKVTVLEKRVSSLTLPLTQRFQAVSQSLNLTLIEILLKIK